MDQFISALGREGSLLLLDCRSRKTELVPMDDPSVALLIVNTNVKHELSGGEYAARRAECEAAAKILGVASLRDANFEMLEPAKNKMSEVVYRRAWHVIGEIARTVDAAKNIRASDWIGAGKLMYASHNSLRGPGLYQFDLALGKTFTIVEGKTLEFKWENYNATNHVNLANPNNTVDQAGAGQITSAADMRQMQFGLHFRF